MVPAKSSDSNQLRLPNIPAMAAAAVATVFNKAFGNRRLWQETKIHPPQKQKLSNCTSTSAAILLCLLCFFSVVCRASDSKQYGVSEGTRMRAIGNKVGFPPELCLLEGRFKAFNFFVVYFLWGRKRKKKFWPYMWAATSIFSSVSIDRRAGEKSHSITPPAVPISHLCFWNDAAAAVSLKLN